MYGNPYIFPLLAQVLTYAYRYLNREIPTHIYIFLYNYIHDHAGIFDSVNSCTDSPFYRDE